MRKKAEDALSRCSEAITVLGDNLRELGYVWISQDSLSSEALQNNLWKIQTATGLLVPRCIALFWEKIGGFSLVDLKHYRHVDFWQAHKIIGKSYFCDGVHIDACNDEWAAFICSDYADWQEFSGENGSEQFLFCLSPDGFHKDNISGGESYGVYEDSNWKPTWQNFVWSGYGRPITALADPPDFLSYLRTALLECAGFPGFFGLPTFEPIKEHILQGVPVF